MLLGVDGRVGRGGPGAQQLGVLDVVVFLLVEVLEQEVADGEERDCDELAQVLLELVFEIDIKNRRHLCL